MRRAAAWVTGFLVTFAAAGAFAHALNLFVHEEGGAIKGSAYFTGGVPAKNVTVRAIDSADKIVAELQTDAEGNFVYTGPRPGEGLRFVVSTPDGHRAESTLEGPASVQPATADAATTTASSTSPSASQATSYERQLGAIQEAFDRLEHRLWLRDVIGGIGYSQCGSTWYQPYYQGTTVQYVIVNPPQ